jgi:hypothetical protein
MDPLDGDDAVDIDLRPPDEAAARLLVLVAIARRGFLELRPDLVADDSPEAERFDLQSWLAEEKLLGSMSPGELALIEAPVGRPTPEDSLDATWRIEDAVVLAWALELLPSIPPYDEATDAAGVIDALPAPWSRTTGFRTTARLRDEATIAAAREQAEVWSDRADIYWWQQEITNDRTAAEADPRQIAIDLAAEAFAAGYIPPLVDGDFSTRHGAYRGLASETVEQLQMIASRRLHALNWLCGLPEH